MMGRLIQKKEFCLGVIVFTVIAAILIGCSISGLAKTKAAEEASYKYYTSIAVKKGDTLWSIAAEHMTGEYSHIEDYIEEIRALNHLPDHGVYAGEYLMIPYYSNEIL